jgi:hypothetical protein
MATEVKIKLIRMGNVCINCCSSWDIATSSNLDFLWSKFKQTRQKQENISEIIDYLQLDLLLKQPVQLEHYTGPGSNCSF